MESLAYLQKIGFSDEALASRNELVRRNPATLKRNYEGAVRLLRHDPSDRKSGRKTVIKYPQIVGINPQALEANVQFLYSIDINYNNGALMTTTPNKKREKMAWMLRELFDYRNLSPEKRRMSIYALRDMLEENPSFLSKSLTALEGIKPLLLKIARDYRE